MSNSKDPAIRTILLSILGSVGLAIIKAFAGIVGNSYALIADAIESATDVFASFLVFLGLRYAAKPADENHPYGHGKIEPLVTFVVVAFLLVSATVIAYQAVLNLQSEQVTPESWTLIVLGVIIVWKEISYQLVSRKGRELHSTSLQADAWHHRSDAITSLTAFIGILIAVVLGDGFEKADDWAALVASGFIVYNAFRIFRPALGEIMDEHQYEEMDERIREVSLKVEGILATEKCHIRKAGMEYHVDLHAIVRGSLSVRKGHDLAHELQNEIKREIPEISQVMIHIEPEEEMMKL
jgi:cation diffusion facilitator family transporter